MRFCFDQLFLKVEKVEKIEMLSYTYSVSNIKITMESSATTTSNATTSNASSTTAAANTTMGSAILDSAVLSTSSTPLRQKCLNLIIKLGPYNKSGTPFIKNYTTSLAKMLGFIVNMYDNETLDALIDGLENVLVAYMPDITELFVAKTLEETDYNGRYELLKHVNNMVADQMQYPCNIEGTLEILWLVTPTSAFPPLKSGAKLSKT